VGLQPHLALKDNKGHRDLPASALPSWQRWSSVGPSRGRAGVAVQQPPCRQLLVTSHPCNQPGAARDPAAPLPGRTAAEGPLCSRREMRDRATSPGGGWPYRGQFRALQQPPPRPSCQSPTQPIQTTQRQPTHRDNSANQGSSRGLRSPGWRGRWVG